MTRKSNVWKWIAAVLVLILACAAGYLIGQSAAAADAQAAQELNYRLNRSELDGLLGALRQFDLREGTIVTLRQSDFAREDGRTIRVVPAHEWFAD